MKITTTLFNEEPQEHLLDNSTITVGRSPQCEVVINHESMSRKHCLIEVEDGKIYVSDLGSTNGVTIDGQRLKPNEKTFYLNSLPLVIGAATVTIDLTEDKTPIVQKITPAKAITKESSRERTSTLELETKQLKTQKKKSTAPQEDKDKDKKKKEVMAAIVVALILVIAIFLYFTQE